MCSVCECSCIADSPTGAESPASGPAASTAIAEAPDALGNPPLPRGDYDTLPRGPAYHPHDYSVMQTVTMLQGSDIWPLPDELRDRLLQHYNDTLTPWPHNLTFINAYVSPMLLSCLQLAVQDFRRHAVQ